MIIKNSKYTRVKKTIAFKSADHWGKIRLACQILEDTTMCHTPECDPMMKAIHYASVNAALSAFRRCGCTSNDSKYIVGLILNAAEFCLSINYYWFRDSRHWIKPVLKMVVDYFGKNPIDKKRGK